MAWDSDRARDVTRVKGPAHAARQTNSGNRRRAAAQSAAAVKLCKVRSKTKGPCANVVVAGELFCQQHLYHKDKPKKGTARNGADEGQSVRRVQQYAGLPEGFAAGDAAVGLDANKLHAPPAQQAAYANGGAGPTSPPPCRGFKSMKMRWLRQYEDDQKKRVDGPEPSPATFGSGVFAGAVAAAAPVEAVGEAPEAWTQSAGEPADADTVPQRDTHPQRAEVAAPAASALVAAGAASSTHADGRAVAPSGVTSAVTTPDASAPAIQLNRDDAPSVADPGAVSTSAGTVPRDADRGQAATGQQAVAQGQREAASPPQHAADSPPAGTFPVSVAAERGSGPPAVPAAPADSQEPTPMFSASGPAAADADGMSRQAATAAMADAFCHSGGHAEALEVEAMAGGLGSAAAPQEDSASRGTSPGPGVRPGFGTAAGVIPDGIVDGGTGEAPEASSAGGGGGGREADLRLIPPRDAGDGSASDTWESPDLPPHLAKLGLRIDALAGAPPPRPDFSAALPHGPSVPSGPTSGAVVAAQQHVSGPFPADLAGDWSPRFSPSGQPPLLLAPGAAAAADASDSSPMFARAAAASPVKPEPVGAPSLAGPSENGTAGGPQGLPPPSRVRPRDGELLSLDSAPATGRFGTDADVKLDPQSDDLAGKQETHGAAARHNAAPQAPGGAAAAGAEARRPPGEPSTRRGHAKAGAKRKHGDESRPGQSGASAAPAKAARASTLPQNGKGPGQMARAAAARQDPQEDDKCGGDGGIRHGISSQHAVGNSTGVNGGGSMVADAAKAVTEIGVERVEVELLDGSATDAKTLGKLELPPAASMSEVLAALYEKHRAVLPSDASALQLAFQDSEGDWMLLGAEQPWPGKREHVVRRIVVSKA